MKVKKQKVIRTYGRLALLWWASDTSLKVSTVENTDKTERESFFVIGRLSGIDCDYFDSVQIMGRLHTCFDNYKIKAYKGRKNSLGYTDTFFILSERKTNARGSIYALMKSHNLSKIFFFFFCSMISFCFFLLALFVSWDTGNMPISYWICLASLSIVARLHQSLG